MDLLQCSTEQVLEGKRSSMDFERICTARTISDLVKKLLLWYKSVGGADTRIKSMSKIEISAVKRSLKDVLKDRLLC